ncbi:IX [Bat mastadenovirus WIV17]|uniref:IX n=1 Tax=Bat mastadenovirus WIV17 TaxID=1986505 RepID=A0A1X9RIR3_9ADEN|nr:IX [Bat mastadenovirus WIV17]ARQ79745.1 IX [Bat mastadenovirus WIV17]
MSRFSTGAVNTAFLTTRLPTWAGTPQNVSGSDLEGQSIPASNALPNAETSSFADIYKLIDNMDKEINALKQTLDRLISLTPAA